MIVLQGINFTQNCENDHKYTHVVNQNIFLWQNQARSLPKYQ